MTTTQQERFAPLDETQAAQILGIALTSDPRIVHAAYRTAARRSHPDAGGSAGQFTAVRNAYETLLWRQGGQPQVELPVAVQAGAAVWARSRIQPRAVLIGVLTSGVLVGSAAMFASPAAFHVALGLAIVLLTRSLYVAVGRPSLNPNVWRRHWERRRSDGSDWPTGPIPVMTDERMRQYERTGR